MLKHIIYALLAANLGLALWLGRAGADPQVKGSVRMLLNADRIRLVKREEIARPVSTEGVAGSAAEPERDESNTHGQMEPSDEKAAVDRASTRETTQGNSGQCWVLEGMNDRQSASMEVALTRLDLPYRVFRNLVSEPAGYVVIAGPLASEAEATALRARARAQRLDAFVLTRGQWKNGVSLGVFSSRKNALRRQQEARSKLPDVDVTVEQRFRERTENRLLVPAWHGGKQILSTQLNEIAHKNQIKTDWAKKSCKDVEFSPPNQ